MGRLTLPDGKIVTVFASETCAFDLINAEYTGEVEPGEMVIIGPEGMTREFYTKPAKTAHCVFEHVYFARPDSFVFGKPVAESRESMGRLLARQDPIDADVVVPVPDSGVAAAIGYAAESGIPYKQALIRNHYVGRTFIEPSQAIRDFGVKLKLNPVRHLLEGKRVVLVDDSIVRGTTSRKIVRMVRNAGAREVHLRISCPPTVSPCFYGVDTPSPTRTDRRQSTRSKKSATSSKPIRSHTWLSTPSAKRYTTAPRSSATPATQATIQLSFKSIQIRSSVLSVNRRVFAFFE